MNKHCFPEGPFEQTETNNNPERSPVLDAGGKPECPEKNLRKLVLDWKPNGHTAPGPRIEPGSVVHNVEEVPASPIIISVALSDVLVKKISKHNQVSFYRNSHTKTSLKTWRCCFTELIMT